MTASRPNMRAPHATARPWLPSEAQVTVGAGPGCRVKARAAAPVSPPIITRRTPYAPPSALKLPSPKRPLSSFKPNHATPNSSASR